MASAGGEFLESEPLFNFITAIDPQNVLNITQMNYSSSHPCFLLNKVKFNNGIIRCNSKATNVIEIRLQNLNLNGIINADSLCRLQRLKSVNLAQNYISGSIPSLIMHCTRLVYLNLSSNMLSGRVPNKALTKLKFLRKLDISNNDFSGRRHLFAYDSKSSRLSDRNSTSEKLDDVDKYAMPPSSATISSDNDVSSNKPWYKDGKTMIPISIGVVLFLVFFYFVGKKAAQLNSEREAFEVEVHKQQQESNSSVKRPKPVVSEEVKLKERDSELVFFVEEQERFTLEDLLQATADLRNESFGSSLYKVVLKNNMHYAVKRLKNLQVSSDEFGETLRQISGLRHPNILPLVGYRSTSEGKLLIYKYQSNGSLLYLLRGKLQLEI